MINLKIIIEYGNICNKITCSNIKSIDSPVNRTKNNLGNFIAGSLITDINKDLKSDSNDNILG